MICITFGDGSVVEYDTPLKRRCLFIDDVLGQCLGNSVSLPMIENKQRFDNVLNYDKEVEHTATELVAVTNDADYLNCEEVLCLIKQRLIDLLECGTDEDAEVILTALVPTFLSVILEEVNGFEFLIQHFHLGAPFPLPMHLTQVAERLGTFKKRGYWDHAPWHQLVLFPSVKHCPVAALIDVIKNDDIDALKDMELYGLTMHRILQSFDRSSEDHEAWSILNDAYEEEDEHEMQFSCIFLFAIHYGSVSIRDYMTKNFRYSPMLHDAAVRSGYFDELQPVLERCSSHELITIALLAHKMGYYEFFSRHLSLFTKERYDGCVFSYYEPLPWKELFEQGVLPQDSQTYVCMLFEEDVEIQHVPARRDNIREAVIMSLDGFDRIRSVKEYREFLSKLQRLGYRLSHRIGALHRMSERLEEWSPYKYRRRGNVSQLEIQSYEMVNEFMRILSTLIPFDELDEWKKLNEEARLWIAECLGDT